jgi:hypothetical protein
MSARGRPQANSPMAPTSTPKTISIWFVIISSCFQADQPKCRSPHARMLEDLGHGTLVQSVETLRAPWGGRRPYETPVHHSQIRWVPYMLSWGGRPAGRGGRSISVVVIGRNP